MLTAQAVHFGTKLLCKKNNNPIAFVFLFLVCSVKYRNLLSHMKK